MNIAEMLIERHGKEFHTKMQAASIGLVGMGGLGSNIAVALIRMGLGTLTAFDFDRVELSNIHRQQYYLDQIGMKKCEALRINLERISPLTSLVLSDERINETNVGNRFSECDIIIEAVDDKHTKRMLFESCCSFYPDKWYIGASGVAGYTDTPPLKVKRIGKKAFLAGDFTTGSEEGLTASRVGIAAHMQANLAVNLIMGNEYK